MAGFEKSENLEGVLKPFYHRASEAEERLRRIEAAFANKEGGPNVVNEELSSVVKELQTKLENAKAEQIAEQEKASKELQKLAAENAKLQYQIIHLVRALKESDNKLGV
ncbi:threonine-tRNA ligase 2 [Tasmannia lanceolata]|uniref:threonine-tRNA ligase 2 n=1 Tax=Tasmannia lanceolata TaxID=3420 RepID=UPI0040632543